MRNFWKFCEILQNSEFFTKNLAKLCKKSANFEFGAVQKFVNLVDLEKYCKMSIYLPKSALIQPRTSRLKLALRPSAGCLRGAGGSGSAVSASGPWEEQPWFWDASEAVLGSIIADVRN